MAKRGKKGYLGEVVKFYCPFLRKRVPHVLIEVSGNPHPKYFWKCTKENCEKSNCKRFKYGRKKDLSEH